MGVMGREVPLLRCFFFFSLFLWFLVTCIYYLLTHTLLLLYRFLSLVLFLTTSHIPHPLTTGFAASTLLLPDYHLFNHPSIHHQYSLPLPHSLGLLFPHIISTYHIVTIAP